MLSQPKDACCLFPGYAVLKIAGKQDTIPETKTDQNWRRHKGWNFIDLWPTVQSVLPFRVHNYALCAYFVLYSTQCARFELVKSPEVTLCVWPGYKPSINKRITVCVYACVCVCVRPVSVCVKRSKILCWSNYKLGVSSGTDLAFDVISGDIGPDQMVDVTWHKAGLIVPEMLSLLSNYSTTVWDWGQLLHRDAER